MNPSDLACLPPSIGIVVFVVYVLIHLINSRRAWADQKWAGTIYAAIQHAHAEGFTGPTWLQTLENSFESAYTLMHGKKPDRKTIGRGVADMANVIGNHMLANDHASGYAQKFNDVISKDEDRRQKMMNAGSPTETAPEPRKPLRSFSTMGLLALVLIGSAAFGTDKPDAYPVTIESIAFAPNNSSKLGYGDCDCTNTVVDVLSHAKKTVLVQAYNFTSEPIAAALIAAHKRGVSVKVIGDRSVPTERSSKGQECVDAGIAVVIDKKHHIAHNKVIVIDGEITITGSFNWTDSAENNNAENLLVIHSDKIAAIYTANWKVHADHAEPFGK
jgi:phosphatidylserine/phosphatidylglycerophosphate/cardiolipin synthase-like enzyme